MNSWMVAGIFVGLNLTLNGVKDLMFLHSFGINHNTDLFQYVFNLVSGFQAVLFGAAVSVSVHYFSKAKNEIDGKQSWLGNAICRDVNILSVIVSLIFIIYGQFVWGGTDKFYLLLEMSPLVVLGVFNAKNVAILNAEGKIFWVSVVPAIAPIPPVLYLLVCQWMGFQLNIKSFILALNCGQLLQTIWSDLIVRRLPINVGKLPRWDMFSNRAGIFALRKKYAKTVFGSLVLFLIGVANQRMASTCGEGALTVYVYGQKIVLLGAGVVGSVISAVLMPKISYSLYASKQGGRYEKLFNYGGIFFLIGLSLVAILWVAGPFLVELMYEHGKFEARNSVDVLRVMRFTLLMLPFYFGGQVFNQYLIAKGLSHKLTTATVAAALICIPAVYVLQSFLGLDGVALNTVLMYVVTFFVVCSFSRQTNK